MSTTLGPAVPATTLPTLRPGVDRLPTACGHCGSPLLGREEPLGGHARGRVWCGTCSRQLCWLASPLRIALPPVRRTPSPDAPPVQADAALRRPIVAERFERTEDCGPTCTERYGHDPAPHKHAGRQGLLDELARVPTGIIRTGQLVVDFESNRVYVDGREARLQPRVWLLCRYLAQHVGRLCPADETVEAVWGTTYAASWRLLAPNALRTYINRLREGLGPARALIETRTGLGYVLHAVEPIIGTEELSPCP